ncbi:hypothetical protein GCM10007301_27130 [Azorhizobium oxalatiphilum]|uniref:Uncharacterized protein n=1 Tax=Azorhizobium oxalatiphilum TaxID=980631 RepID=A0A917FAY2_9HYPH|nr:hypothetical protein [Azorhizobium oxalatiphilum]GGF66005.1 hypothetical protein GCM10007301_27130 [Azorhizobium oxalatiphilum]
MDFLKRFATGFLGETLMTLGILAFLLSGAIGRDPWDANTFIRLAIALALFIGGGLLSGRALARRRRAPKRTPGR